MEFILCAALLAADEANDWYVWGGGYSEEIEIDIDWFGSSGASPKETGLRFGFGKSLNDKFNLEFEYGSNEWTDPDPFFSSKIDYTHFGAVLGYKLPVDESFTIVPKVGFGFTDWGVSIDVDGTLPENVPVSFSGRDITFKFGVHAEYAISESVTAQFGYRMETTPFDFLFVSGDIDSSGLIFGANFSF